MKTKAFARSRDERKRLEMRFAHLKTHHGLRAHAAAGSLRRTRRVPPRRDRTKPQDACELYLATTAGRDNSRPGVSLSCSRSSSCPPHGRKVPKTPAKSLIEITTLSSPTLSTPSTHLGHRRMVRVIIVDAESMCNSARRITWASDFASGGVNVPRLRRAGE